MKLVTAYLHVIHGNDETAALDDRTRPFKTHGAAMRALVPKIADSNNCTVIKDISGEPQAEAPTAEAEAEA